MRVTATDVVANARHGGAGDGGLSLAQRIAAWQDAVNAPGGLAHDVYDVGQRIHLAGSEAGGEMGVRVRLKHVRGPKSEKL